MQNRVVHIASTHRVSDARIFQKECRTLVDNGYDVTLIIPHERDEVIEGVKIKAVPLPRSGKDRLVTVTKNLYQAALSEPADSLFHFHDAELLPWMLRLKRRGRTVVYDVHEDTPNQVWYQHWIPWLARPFVSLGYHVLERWAGWRFDGIVAAVPGITHRFPSRKTIVLRNYPLLEEFRGSTLPENRSRGNNVTYVGGLTLSRGVKEMMAAISAVDDELDATLWLCGQFFPKELERDIEQFPGYAKTRTSGWLSREEVDSKLAESRIGIVTLLPTRQYLKAYPTKMFEYMAAGLPVVASNFPVWAEFVNDANCGLLVDPGDPAAIAKAITYLLRNPEEGDKMGQQGRSAVVEKYNWGLEKEKLLTLYRNLGFSRATH